jgi:hypothetical protein
MYHEHNHEFIVEKTKNIPYWRYMDFWKFLNLIIHQNYSFQT